MNSGIQIAPSILSADFSDLGKTISICERSGVEMIHLDVMDNRFVPNLTIGPVVVKSLRPRTELLLDVHLMVTHPANLVEPFAGAGADGITFHIEAADQTEKVIGLIRQRGKRVGISIKPGTPLETIDPFLDRVDLILLMSVEPGFGGQEYLTGSTNRIAELQSRLIKSGLRNQVLIEVDGGIKLSNAREAAGAGADILVVGSAIFETSDPVQTIRQFKSVVNP